MKKIASFTINHNTLNPGVYVSRIDGDITTYDMRFIKPNTPRFYQIPLCTQSNTFLPHMQETANIPKT